MNGLAEIAEQVARGLASFEIEAGSAYISTPLLYPGGAPVVVRFDGLGTGFAVTDAGFGQREAHMLGGDRIFTRAAADAAKRFGVRFDGVSVFAADAGQDDLIPAVVAVANASRTAVEQTAYRVAEKAAGEAKEIMRVRLQSLFGGALNPKPVKVRGASNDEWDFDAAVQREGRIVLFEVITPHANSVAAAVAKFVDVADRPDRPGLVGVLSDPRSTPHRRLIERSAATLPIAAEDRAWLQAAA